MYHLFYSRLSLRKSFASAVKSTRQEGVIKYERHVATKHGNGVGAARQKATFSTTALEEIVQNAVQSVQEKIVFAEHLRKELATCTVQLVSGSDGFKFLKVCYEKLAKKDNAEKFYSDFYGEVSVNSCRFFTGLSRNAATLLTIKVADSMVAHCKKQNQLTSINTNSKVNQQCTLSDKEVVGLQYLGGYVLQNLYTKHARFDVKCYSNEILVCFFRKLSCFLVSFWQSYGEILPKLFREVV